MAEGLAVAVTEEAWERFARMDAVAPAAWLHETAAGLKWARYRKSPRGPKKEAAVKRTCRGAHRSTARVLREKAHKK